MTKSSGTILGGQGAGTAPCARAMFATLAALALSGCVLAPTTGQLSDFKKWEAANNLTAIESQNIDASCTAANKASAECAQLAEIQGRACLTLAKGEAAANAACPPATDSARRRLQCAAADFDAARAGKQFPPGQLDQITEMRARALYCHANTLSRADGLAEAQQAGRELATLGENPERDQLAASAALYAANTNQVAAAERCSAARNAVKLADRGLRNSPSSELQQGLSATRDHATAVAGSLSNCSVP
jgi:hypothetical protein